MKLINVKTKKEPNEIIEEIKKKSSEFNFIIREIYDMSKIFKQHNVNVSDEFQYYSIMICNPSKAYESIIKNPLRGAVLLPPKQITIYKHNGEVFIGYLAFEQNDIKEVLSNDEEFEKGLSNSCNQIINLINQVK